MHVHLPKAFHGWRELAKEVGIIVLGVLIALSFEQLAQMWRWHEQAREVRQALTNELAYDALFASERVAVQQCFRDRITHLATKLNNEGSRWTADPMIVGKAAQPIAGSGNSLVTSIPPVYRPPHRPWVSDEWETAKSTGVLDHMSRDDVHDLEFIYGEVNYLRLREDEETSIEPQLNFLSFDQDLQPQSRIDALKTLSYLDALNADIALIASQMLGTIHSMGLELQTIRRRKRVQTYDVAHRQLLKEDMDRYGNCVGTRLQL